MTDFIDDPTDIYDEIRPAWNDYRDHVNEIVSGLVDNVVVWRDAKDQVLFPIHPMSSTIRTDAGDEIWRDRTSLFVPSVKDVNDRVRHGFNDDGQVLIAERRWFSEVALWGDQTIDVASAVVGSEGGYVTIHQRPHYERVYLNDASRILRTVDYSPTEDEDMRLETFEWRDGRVVKSRIQGFEIDGEIPHFFQDKAPEELARMYRVASGKYREFIPSRQIRTYQYESNGTLVGVEQESLYHKNKKTTIYTRGVGDTVDSVYEQLLPMLTKQVVATLKRAKEHQPIATVALLFSAEHVHTGLPWGIGCLAGDSIEDLDIDEFSIHLPWPPEKRTGQSLQKCINRFLIAVETTEEYRDEIAPIPFRKLLWETSVAVANEMKKSRAVADEFTIFPFDDHGDIDPFEDFKKCLPNAQLEDFPALAKIQSDSQ